MENQKIINVEQEEQQVQEQTATVPYIVYEQSEYRHERRDKRNFWLVIILIALLFGTNLAWLLYEMQWQVTETVTTTEVDATDGGDANYIGDNANYIGNDGDIVNGEDQSSVNN